MTALALDDQRHLLLVGDLELDGAGQLLSKMVLREGRTEYDHCYTDPPWNSGIARMFRRWSDRGLDRSVDVDALLDLTVRLCAEQVSGWSFVQIGRQKRATVVEAARRHGLLVRGELSCANVDESGRVLGEAWLVACCRPGSAASRQDVPTVPEGSAWMDLCGGVLGQVSAPGETVVDWFMGQGTVLRVAEQLGLRSYGLELNPRRAAQARRRLEVDRRGS